MTIASRIKNATTASKATKVDAEYKPGAYSNLNAGVTSKSGSQISSATKNAESAYQMAAKNNQTRHAQTTSQNNMAVKQTSSAIKKKGYSLTSRNVSGAAAARSAASANTALSNANRNAAVARDTAVSKATQSAYKTMAENERSNTEKDIGRSTQRAKVEAQQKYQANEAQKSRNLKNAINDRTDNLKAKKRKYDKQQRQLSTYSKTLPNRHYTVKSVNKAIAKMKKSN